MNTDIDIIIAKNLLLNQTCDNCAFRYMGDTNDKKYCWTFHPVDNGTTLVELPDINTCGYWTKYEIKRNHDYDC